MTSALSASGAATPSSVGDDGNAPHPPHFLEYDQKNTFNPLAPYAVLPVPYERTVSFGTGTAAGPDAILKASREIERFDEEFMRAPGLQVQTLPAVNCRQGSDAETLADIHSAASQITSQHRFLLALGGEHTITAPLVKAALKTWPDLCVLHLDAHLDLRDQFRGSRLSHACVMRRVMELGAPIVHVGIRSLCEEEFNLVKQHSLPVFWARDIVPTQPESWIASVISRLKQNVYISLDIDALDPSIVPGTGTPEPGGLSWLAVTALLRRVCEACQVVGADLVETVPVPGTPVSEYVAARLATKLLIYHARKK